MIASNLQVHKDALALMKLIIHYINTSPRTLRYSLGGIIIKSMASCISEIRLANSNEGVRRIEHINLAFGELEDARTFCRVFTEELVPNTTYERQKERHESEPTRYPEPKKNVRAWDASKSANTTCLFDKIGKQLNGWKKAEQSRRTCENYKPQGI